MTRLIEVQKIVRKDNRTAFIDENEIWYSTFDAVLAKEVGEGGKYKIEFETNEKGFNNLIKIEVVQKSESELGIRNRNNQIVRQHSQEMALRYLIANNDRGFGFDEVIEYANKFDEDVLGQVEPF